MVNGAGHMVPTDQPEAAFTMLGHFLYNEHDWKQWLCVINQKIENIKYYQFLINKNENK